MSHWILIKYNDNYADEFDVAGFWIMSKLKWDHQVELIRYGVYPVSLGLGNDSITYDTPAQLLNTLQAVTLGSATANTLQDILIVDGHYGLVPEFPQVPLPGQNSPLLKSAFCSYCQSMAPVSQKTEDHWDNELLDMVHGYIFYSHYMNPGDEIEHLTLCMGSNEEVDESELV